MVMQVLFKLMPFYLSVSSCYTYMYVLSLPNFTGYLGAMLYYLSELAGSGE